MWPRGNLITSAKALSPNKFTFTEARGQDVITSFRETPLNPQGCVLNGGSYSYYNNGISHMSQRESINFYREKSYFPILTPRENTAPPTMSVTQFGLNSSERSPTSHTQCKEIVKCQGESVSSERTELSSRRGQLPPIALWPTLTCLCVATSKPRSPFQVTRICGDLNAIHIL